MGHPARVDDTQHDLAFQVAHHVGTKQVLLLGVDALEVLSERVGDVFRLVVVFDRRDVEVVVTGHAGGPRVDRLHVPVVERGALGAVLLHHSGGGVGDDAGDATVHVLTVQDGVALLVNHLALQVHDVVVFEDVLTRGEVHRLDLALRALDRLRYHRRLNGLVVGHVRLLHHTGDGIHAIAAEQAHEVVFEREVELRRARVALASRTATQLVVDTARLVALGADDAQAARGEHLLVFLFANGARTNECLVAFLIRRRRGCVLGDLLALGRLVVDMARGIKAPLA